MASKNVVILATSADKMGDHTTGAWSEEITGPFYVFKDAGCTVTIASVSGGTIPIDAGSLSETFKTANDTRFETDGDIAKLSGSPAIGDVDLSAADCLFLSGGHGTCADFVDGAAPTAVSRAYSLGKVVGAVCHGPMGLVNAKDGDAPLLAGKKVCAFSDVEEGQVGLTEKVPFALEARVKELGATYVPGEPWSNTAVRDGRLVTGQNPQSSVKCAQLCLQAMGIGGGGVRRPVVGGNWKCNPDSTSKLDGLIANIQACDTSKCDVYVCPSTLHVPYCCGKFSNGALVTPQNCNIKGCGAFTGEMSVEQMKDLGITNVLIGHSERRGEFGILPYDTNETLAAKLKYILDAGCTCVLCIGEPKEIRERGLEAVLAEMHIQLTQVYSLLDPAKVVIAYEPVWAIGTGLTATPEDAQATHAGIRALISEHASAAVAGAIRIQYGGSANAGNAAALSAMEDIDGFLVGGASLKPEFKDIVAAISAAK